MGAIQDQEAAARATGIASIESVAAVRGCEARSARADGSAQSIVEVLPAELECVVFLEGEALEEAEVEVHAAGKTELVALHVAEGQTGRQLECGWVIAEHPEFATQLIDLGRGNIVGIADQIES